MRKLKLIVTADEATCDSLDARLRDHKLVSDTFQSTGNWYTNGETGPEWFTVSFVVAERKKEEFESVLNHELGMIGRSVANLFWDWA